ncbi:MAG: hypothetical protein PHZ25_02575 [Candidatus Pacebacteria bacterium]|nr:hypothetical protein [Candidatus Paceibacterota bacterium]
MKNITKTTLFTAGLSFLTVALAIFMQLRAEESLSLKCSYLDPIGIDILAFLAALFLAGEGMIRIYEHKNYFLSKQITRAIRVAFGCAIMTLHIMQFWYK